MRPYEGLVREFGLCQAILEGVAELLGKDLGAEFRGRERAAFDASDGMYGRRRIYDKLAAGGMSASEHRIARIMREERLAARGCKRKRGYGSYKGEISRHLGNRVRCDFRAGLPNFLWLADVTQFGIPAGKVYLGPVLDCFDGAVVSWTASTGPDVEMANSMLRGALDTVPERQRRFLALRSDCGCRYCWPEWISICEEAGITRSMPANGRGPNNSAVEGFFDRMKNEAFCGRDWGGIMVYGFIARIGEYIERYNTKRIKRSLSGMSPMVYRKSLGLAALRPKVRKELPPFWCSFNCTSTMRCRYHDFSCPMLRADSFSDYDDMVYGSDDGLTRGQRRRVVLIRSRGD